MQPYSNFNNKTDNAALSDLEPDLRSLRMERKSYLVKIEEGVGSRDERELLSSSVEGDRADFFWGESSMSGYSQKERAIIVTADAALLDELRRADWEVGLAPAGFYSGEKYNIDDCVVVSEGALPEKAGRRST
jgi:hypothetical protein